MRFQLLLSSLILAAATAAMAAPPADYYSTINTQTGAALKTELRAIISGQRGYPTSALSYDGARVALQDSVDNVGGGQVRMLYTNELRSENEWPGDQSREHTWPQSLGAGVSPLVSDMHHLFLCESGINSTRGNMPFGFVTAGTAVPNPTGDPLDQNYYKSGVWQVSPRHRGDVARAMFYMETRYSQLTLLDRGDVPDSNEMGYLSDLLQWHQQDPVDAFEQQRNDRVFTYQNNRNPYVDNPSWVLMVYDPGSATVSNGDDATVTFLNRAPATGLRNTTIPMISLTVSAQANEWDTGLVSVTKTGTVADANLTVGVYTDGNNNGIVDGADALLASSGFTAGNALLLPSPTPRSTPSIPTRLLLLLTVGAGASAGETVALRVNANGVAHAASGGNDDDPTFAAFNSDTVTLQAGGGGTGSVFISEYIEGASLNKAVEIYNGTASTVDLSGWKVEFYVNGNTTPTPAAGIALVGTILAGDVFVLADDEAAASILAVADQTSTSTFFNGDDAVVLKDSGGNVLDCVGRVGEQAIWGTAPTITQDAVLRRKATILSGDTVTNDVFDPSIEWDGFAVGDFSGLGSHTVQSPNAAPVVGAVSAAILEDVPGDVTVSFTDADDPPASVYTVSTSGATSGAFAPGSVTRTGPGTYAATFGYTPASNASGTVTFTFSVTDNAGPVTVDGHGLSFSVTAVNDDPTLSVIDDQVIDQNGSSGPIALTVGDVESDPALITLSAQSADLTILPVSGVVFGGAGASRTVTLNPTVGQSGGPFEVTVRAEDPDGGSAEVVFEVTVTPSASLDPSSWLVY